MQTKPPMTIGGFVVPARPFAEMIIRSDRNGTNQPVGACTSDVVWMFADMAETNWSSNIVPYGADQTLYLVIDQVGGTGTARREIEVERTDPEAAICDLMQGLFNDPVRVVAFNTLEHWAKDVSAEIALEIQSRCDMDGSDLPEHIKDFVESSTRQIRQSPALVSLRLGPVARSRR